MTDNNSDGRTNLQESIKEHHRQGSLHPEDPEMLMDSASGKGYSQKRLNPSEQSSLSGEPAGAPEQRSLTGGGENRKAGGHIDIVPMVITFALGILVSLPRQYSNQRYQCVVRTYKSDGIVFGQ